MPFDTLDHEILCKKIKRNGVRGQILSWINSDLSDRYQYVGIAAAKTPKNKVDKGVHKGSSLWPLIFILHIH